MERPNTTMLRFIPLPRNSFRRLIGSGRPLQQLCDLLGALPIGVLCQHALAAGHADAPRLVGRQPAEYLGDLLAAFCRQNLAAGLEKESDAFPGVSDDARTRTGSFEDPGWRREPITRHAG